MAAAEIADKLARGGSASLRSDFVDLQLLAARDFAGQQLPDSALAAYRKVLAVQPKNEQALNSSINLLSGQKKYKEALALVDKTLGFYPDDQALLMKKASILQEDEQYDAAVVLLETLYAGHIYDTRIVSILTDAYLTLARQEMKIIDYDAAAAAYRKLLVIAPDNKEALIGIVNIELTRGGSGYEAALDWADKGLGFYPEDRDLQLKKSEALMKLKRYKEAYTITDSLRQRYPFNGLIRDAYLEQVSAEATAQRQRGDTAAALSAYRAILAAQPGDTTALLSMINIYFGGANYPAALDMSQQALALYPQNASFMLKRAAALEQLQDYKEATNTMDTIAKLYPDRLHYQDYLAYLRSKTYHNQIMMAFLNARLDSIQPANIATIQYMHYGKWGSLAARVNFAGRSIGTGLQFELESYVNHSKKWYSYINGGIANQVVFAKYKFNYSLFHSFGKGWEAELGGRFLNFDSISAISAVASLAKYLGDFWLNLRVYNTHVNDQQYFSGTLSARQYLNNKTDFFYTTIGYGNSPDDFSRSYQLDKIIRYTTYSVGGGYKKLFRYRNTVSINATWYTSG